MFRADPNMRHESKISRKSDYISNLGQSSSDRTRLLWPEVKRKIFLALVKLPQVLALLLVHHSQDPCDRLAHNITSQVSLPASHIQRFETHILVSFEAEPPRIFCTRSERSSFLSSLSCLVKSFFDLNISRNRKFRDQQVDLQAAL